MLTSMISRRHIVFLSLVFTSVLNACRFYVTFAVVRTTFLQVVVSAVLDPHISCMFLYKKLAPETKGVFLDLTLMDTRQQLLKTKSKKDGEMQIWYFQMQTIRFDSLWLLPAAFHLTIDIPLNSTYSVHAATAAVHSWSKFLQPTACIQ